MYHYAGNNPIKYVDPDGRWDVAFGNISFGKYDIFTPTKQVNTGNKFADFWLAGICGISNLCAVPFNYASNVLGLVDEGITWLDERWPSEWTLSGMGIREDLETISMIYITNPHLFFQIMQQYDCMLNYLSSFGKTVINKSFKSSELLTIHFEKHGKEIGNLLGKDNYTQGMYIADANYIINNGVYSSELNGYIHFIKGKNYGFVGIDRSTGEITTFHIKNVIEISKKAPSLGINP